MKKIILLTIAAFLLNGCRYVDTSEVYVDAKIEPELKIPAGKDKPNSTSTLQIPKANNQTQVVAQKATAPPDMPIRTKQSDDGKIRIELIKGLPLLTAQTDKSTMWQAMNKIASDNWAIANTDEENCELNLNYTDQAAKERSDVGFFKKLLRRKREIIDYSGNYKLNCEYNGTITEVKFSKQDGMIAKSFLTDNIMNKIYQQFEQ